jgi:DNA topoisomerase I
VARPLVIVESPAKAKTISKFLGDTFDVRASVGHIADLPSKGLAVDVDNGFKPTYELTDRGAQVVKELRTALKGATELYLATDEDREGEAISWHLLEHLKPKVPVKRMVFHEITAAAIDHPRSPVWLRGFSRAVAASQPGALGGAGTEPCGAAGRRA